MKVDVLKGLLTNHNQGALRLQAGDLGVPAVAALIQQFGKALVVDNPKGDAERLSLSGIGTLDTLVNRPIRLWFSSDSQSDEVTGLLVAVEAAGWDIESTLLNFDGRYLEGGTFKSLALVLSARPEDDTLQEFGIGVGVYVQVDGQPWLLQGLVSKDPRKQQADVRLEGQFTDVRLTLNDLAAVVPGVSDYDFAGALPKDVPLADKFHLRGAAFVVNPQMKFLASAGLDLRSAQPWVLVQDKFQFDYLDLSFMIGVPGSGLDPYWVVSTEMTIADGVTLAAGFDSDFTLTAELVHPVPLKPLLSRYFPAADLDMTVDGLSLSVTLSDKSWGFSVAVGTPWVIYDSIEIKNVSFAITGQGTTPSSIHVQASLEIADAQLTLSGDMLAGAGWTFSGVMSHPYNKDVVINREFDPRGDTNLFKSVPPPAKRDASYFLDKIKGQFPGKPVGVPARLDVDIERLSVDFNTKTKDFHFETQIDFGDKVDAVLTYANLHQAGASPPAFEKRATGVITVFPEDTKNSFQFEVGLDLQPDSKHFVLVYNNKTQKSLSLTKLIESLVPSAPSVPDFSITLKDALVGYVSHSAAPNAPTPPPSALFALDMGASIDLSALGSIPLVGKSLSAAKTLQLAFQIVYPVVPPGASFATADIQALNALLDASGPSFPVPGDDEVLNGLVLKTQLRLGDGAPLELKLPVTINQSSGQLASDGNAPPFSAAGSQASNNGVKWLQLDKSFGPVRLQRVGFKFDTDQETLGAHLEGSLTAFGLEIDLIDLSVSTKITGVDSFSPSFDLRGLGISFSKGGVQLQGALLKLHDEYDGLATLQAEELRLSAIGSLLTLEGHPSLMIYAVLDFPLGGAPFFYVTGLAAGFGLNRQLVMPKVDQVRQFPLVADAIAPPQVPSGGDQAGPFISNEMQLLQNYLVPQVGEYFACAGVRFTSFELLDSFVLVNVSFGQKFELDLLGLSNLVVPSQESAVPALAVVSLQVVAAFIPDEGIVSVQGQLTPDSHLLDPGCRLTGGFAFCCWFGPSPHAGDFVVTLGGYHPQFLVPSYYPSAPRLGISWRVSDNLDVTGGLYFALTPRAIMAGGALHATFQIGVDLGTASVDVKAWFTMGADFIVYYKPFHYSANPYVDIGLDLVIHFFGTHRIGFEAGADLSVWGSPFGGHADVRVTVIGLKIGFAVDFGAQAPMPPLLDWDNKEDPSLSFRQSFLPPDQQIASVQIADGLVRKVSVDSSTATSAPRGAPLSGSPDTPQDEWHVINPQALRLQTSSVIPTKQCETAITWAAEEGSGDFSHDTKFGVAPVGMSSENFTSYHRIEITREGVSADSHFVVRALRQDVPGGLWAEQNSLDVNAQALIENVPVAFEIVPANQPALGATHSVPRDQLTYTTHVMANAFSDTPLSTFQRSAKDPGSCPIANSGLWSRIQTEIHDNEKRSAMLAALGFPDGTLDVGEAFTDYAAYAPAYGVLTG